MKNPNLSLEKYFSEHSLDEWTKSAEKLLKGLPLDKLNTKTPENILLKPLYTKEDLNTNLLSQNLIFTKSKTDSQNKISKANYSYLISQKIPFNTDFAYNVQQAILNGVDELNFIVSNEFDWTELNNLIKTSKNNQEKNKNNSESIKDKQVKLFPRFYCKNFNNYKILFKNLNKIPKETEVSIGAGFALAQKSEIIKYLNAGKDFFKNANIKGIFEAKHEKFHQDASDSLTEITAVLSTAKQYLEVLMDNGFDKKDIGKHIRLSLSIGPNFFMELAKFRAIRLLWAGIQKQYNLEPIVHIHAYTGKVNKTIFDPFVNVLRLSTEAFSAMAGGVNSLEIERFDQLFNKHNEFSEHISRNIHHILMDEFEIANVIDPARGSYFIENLTETIMKTVWQQFVDTEKQGGVDKTPELFDTKIKEVKQNRLKKINSRRDVQVGINMFPDSLDNYSLKDFKNIENKTRLSYEYEELKLACMKYKENYGNYPYLIQINYGQTRSFKLRADWVADFFKVSGLEIKQFDNVDSVDSALKILDQNYSNSNSFVILCSKDENYKNFVPEFIDKLKSQGLDSFIMLAGALEKTIENKNINEYINVKTNNYEFLYSLLTKMGVINE